MICVGWLYVYLIVCNDGEWRDTSLIIFTLFNVWLFQLFTENKLRFNPRICNSLAHFGMINNRNKLLDTGIYNPGKMDNLNLQIYITCFLVHLCISNMTYTVSTKLKFKQCSLLITLSSDFCKFFSSLWNMIQWINCDSQNTSMNHYLFHVLTWYSCSPFESIIQSLHFAVLIFTEVLSIFTELWHSWSFIFLEKK